MRFYIEFDDEMEKEIIGFLKNMEREEKSFLKAEMKNLVYEKREEEKEKEQKAKERAVLWEKQRKCNHDFQEYSRNNRDSEGERYWDDDGEYSTVERVVYECSKCEKVEVKMEYSNSRFDY